MSLRGLIIGTALMSFAFTTTKAGPIVFNDEGAPDLRDSTNAAEAGMSVTYAPASSPLLSDDKAIGAAYYDTLNILTTSNPCSAFFGGPAASVDIFNRLILKLEKHYLGNSIGMQMSGETTNIFNARTKRAYRLFEKVTLNLNGPFYRGRPLSSRRAHSRIGTFEPNTKEVRVLIFLHELAHIVKGSDGKWLLPDDGRSEEQSRANSETIESICKDQIRNVGKVETH